MRIVILDLKWSYGIEVLTEQLSRHLGKHSEVSVLSAKKPEYDKGPRKAIEGKHLGSAIALVNPFAYASVLRRIRAINPHVIYIISPHVMNAPLTLLFRWLTGAIVISHIHDPQHAGGPLVSTTANLVSRLQSRWSHRVFCWGKAIRETISRNFRVSPDRISVFRHGPGHRTPADEPGFDGRSRLPRYFSMIGTIIPRKGAIYFLEAARLFNERHGLDVCQFLLAGSGDLRDYQAAIDRIPNLVVCNRFLEDAEVNQFLVESHASVLPYVSGVMQSSFIAIAYGNGCPVIVSNIGSLPEEVEEGRTGFVVEKANAREIADAMSRIITSPNKDRFSDNCVRAYRAKFGWDVICAEMYKDMANTIKQHRPNIRIGQEVGGQ